MDMTDRTQRDFQGDVHAELVALREKVDALLRDRVTPAVTAVTDRAEHAAQAAADEVRTQVGHLSDKVKDQPFAALGLAAVAGFVIASLVRR
jgi:ElaB/YqjD/DUF883 family membrane-anchored ribosome-binding protein